jgi:hypothetical protein
VSAVASLAVAGALVPGASASAATITAGKAGSACLAPAYRTIQAAVDAASSGTTIAVCPGRYVANVTVTKPRVTLTSVSGAASVTITGTGSDSNGNTPTVQLSGAGDAVQKLTVGPDPASGEAIEVDNSQSRPDTGARASANVITGNVLIGSGAATISNNKLSNPSGHPSGISAFGAQVSITNNTVRPSGNTTGISVWNSHGTLASNVVGGAGGSGAGILVAYSPGFTVGPDNQVGNVGYGIEAMGNGAIVTHNTVTASRYGLYANAARNTTFSKNSATRSKSYDCYDGSTGSLSMGTANTWRSNVGKTSWPARICTPSGS